MTPEQQTAADGHIADTKAATNGLQTVQAAGYELNSTDRSPVRHYGNIDRMRDTKGARPVGPRVADVRRAARRPLDAVGGDVPQRPPGRGPAPPGGCLTQWHFHTGACITPGTADVTGVADATGNCADGTMGKTTTEMLHVWFVDLPNGPFGEISGMDPTAVRQAIVDYLTKR